MAGMVVKHLAVFLPNWVGDVVMATPALRALRAHFADARITHVGRPIALELLAQERLADRTLADRGGSCRMWGAGWELVRQLRADRADLAVLLPNSFRSAALAWLGGARRRAGYARNGRSLLLQVRLKPPRDACGRYVPISAIDYYNALACRLGANDPGRRMRLTVSDPQRQQAAGLLARHGWRGDSPTVMLNPGASFGVSKMWRPDRFAALADALADSRAAQIIINAAPSERDIAAEVEHHMRRRPLMNLARLDNSLSLLKALLARCQLLVTNDTGARHVAAAVGTAVVTLFGSTDPRWAAIDYAREAIVRVDVPCGPCRRRICPAVPGPRYHRCMEAITPEMVIAPARRLLDEAWARMEGRA